MFKHKSKSWQNWLNQCFSKKLLASLALVLLVFTTILEVHVGASYFDPNDTNFNSSQTAIEASQANITSTPNTTLNNQNSNQISNELRQRLTNDLQPSNQSSYSNIETLGSEKCVEWYQIIGPACMVRFVINVWGYIIMIIFTLIGGIVDIGVYYAFLLIEQILSANPTAQGSDFWFIAQQIYPVLLNISLLLILFSFYYVGFQYLFGIKSGRVGWQEFLAKVVLAVILVNFSVFLVSIFVSFLHDIGTLFVNIYARGGGSVGGAFQIALKQAAGHNLDAQNFFASMGTLPNIFTPIGDFWVLVFIRIMYVVVGIFILVSLFRLVKIVLTRFVLLFLLLVIAPLGVVLFFSPIKALKDKGDEWLKTLWSQTILYPFFVIALAIGSVFVVNFSQAAMPIGELSHLGHFSFGSQFPRILALLVGFGVIQVIVNFFEKQFEGIASSTWTALKMGAVGAAAIAGSSLWTIGSTAIKGAQTGWQWGNKKFQGKKWGKVGAGAVGVGGFLAGSLLGAGRSAVDLKGGISKAVRLAPVLASALDSLGGEKVADKLANAPGILGKTFRAAQAQDKAFFANFAGLLAKKASFATTEALRKALEKVGFGDVALQLRRDIDIAIDITLPPNDYTGDSRKDLPGIREGWDRAGNAAKLAAYSSLGYDPKLSNSQVLQRLEDIVTGNTPQELQRNYSSYVESVKEIAEEIIKRPEIISKLTPKQIEFFRVNYRSMLRDVKGWEEFVINDGKGILLGDEETRKMVARADAAKGIQAVEEGKINRQNFKDSVYLNTYVANLRANGESEDLKKLGKILDRDFSAFEQLDVNGIPLADYAKELINTGLSRSSVAKSKIFRYLNSRPDIAELSSEEQARLIQDHAPDILKTEFFQVDTIDSELKSASDEKVRANKLEQFMKQNQAFKDFVERWKKQNPTADLINDNAKLAEMLRDYEDFANRLSQAYVRDARGERPKEIAAEFRATDRQYQAKLEDLKKGASGSRAASGGLVGPNGQPIRNYVASRRRNSGSGGSGGGGSGGSGGGNGGPVNPAGAGGSGGGTSGPAGTGGSGSGTGGSAAGGTAGPVAGGTGGSGGGAGGSGNSGGGGSTNSPGNTPTNSNIQGPQGSAPTSGNNNGGNGGSAGATPAPSQAPQSSSPASSPTPAAPSTSTPNQPQSQPNIQVNIIADLQELQNVKQQLADYIQQAASLNLTQEIDRLNQQVEEAIKKVQAGIPKGIDPTELAAKITSITRAQYNIGDQVSKLGPQAGSKDPEISSHIQSIKNALDEINQYYQHSSSNNFGN